VKQYWLKLVLAALVALLFAGCSATPENPASTSGTVEHCDKARNPDECRWNNKKGGSDVPTVDQPLKN